MQFAAELARVLPPGIPHREQLIEKSAQHLLLIASANERMNLTRITGPAEAAIKHVYDSIAPWEHFREAKHVLDAGTGAGFPGIPLSIVLPEVRFTLAESVQKKARFVDAAVESLSLSNVHVAHHRAEEIARSESVDVITARAVAPIARMLDLFRNALKRGARLLLYKGPDVDAELAEARKHGVNAAVLCRYELPEGLGKRTLVELKELRCVARATTHRRGEAKR